MTTGFRRLEGGPWNVRWAPSGMEGGMFSEEWHYVGLAQETYLHSFRSGSFKHRWVTVGLVSKSLCDIKDCMLSLVSLDDHWLIEIVRGWCMSEQYLKDPALHGYTYTVLSAEKTWHAT